MFIVFYLTGKILFLTVREIKQKKLPEAMQKIKMHLVAPKISCELVVFFIVPVTMVAKCL